MSDGGPAEMPPEQRPPVNLPPQHQPPIPQRPTVPFNAPRPAADPAQRSRRGANGSWGVRQGFAKMAGEFGTVPTPASTSTTLLPGSDGPGYGAPGGPGNPAGSDDLPPVSDARPLVANEVYNKVALLSGIALVAGAVTFFIPVSSVVALPCVLAALGVAMWGLFVPHMAKTLAPVYAVLEGLALGVISRLYNEVSHGIVPIAVVATAAIFLGTLAAYRTGLVKVTNRFIMTTVVMGFGLLAAMLVAILGVQVPGLGSHGTSLVVFGVLYLLVAVMDLFVDFEFVNRAAKAGISADAEWYGAFIIMFAVVMVYLALLRILAGRR